jgi:hypothetical protein
LTNIFEKHITSIFRPEEETKQESSIKPPTNCFIAIQKIALFISTVVRISNPTSELSIKAQHISLSKRKYSDSKT